MKLKRGVLPQKHKHPNVLRTIHLAPSTPFAGALNRIDKALSKSSRRRKDRVRVIGMGRAIQNVLQVAAGLSERKYSVSIRTLSLKAVDERIDERKGTAAMEQRRVPAVELLVESPY